jgi:hypothetical protein
LVAVLVAVESAPAPDSNQRARIDSAALSGVESAPAPDSNAEDSAAIGAAEEVA